MSLSEDRIAALKWQAKHTADEIIDAREAVMRDIEAKGRQFWEDGSAVAWLDTAVPTVRKVVETVNGPLLHYLGEKAMHTDVNCIEMLRVGAPLYGRLQSCGIGSNKVLGDIGDVAELQENCAESNEQLIKQLKNDRFENQLHALTLEDASLGRMSYPMPFSKEHMGTVRLHQRFGVEQGLKPNGDTKVRAVDNMSWSSDVGRRPPRKRAKQSINGCSEIPECIRHHHLDDLLAAIQLFRELMDCIPGLFKADVNAIFRRLPLNPDHQWAVAVAYKRADTIMVSLHNACMFGAYSSVYNWERLAELIIVIAVRWLGICFFRYVDDLFAPERAECMQHALNCVARLALAVLGTGAIVNRKLDCGCSLEVLGVRCRLNDSGLYLFFERTI